MKKMRFFCEMEKAVGYERLDGCYGTVTGSCRSGAFLTLDNGEDAFAYKLANLRPGSVVLCTVRRLADKERGIKMLVSIDSVVEYAPLAA